MILDRHHLILYGGLAVALFIGSWLWADHVSHKADLTAAVAEQKAQAADKLNQQLQAQYTSQIQVLTQQSAALQAQVAGLAQAITVRDAAVLTQKKTDATLPPSDLAARWNWLIKVPTAVKPAQTGYSVTPEGAVATIQALEDVPRLEANNKDLTASIGSLNQVVANGEKTLSLEKAAHQSDKDTCKLDIAAKDADIKQVKANAAKAKRKWAVIGAIFGFVARGFAKF